MGFLSPDNGGTEGGAKTLESKTEQFYVEAKLEQFSRWGAPREQRDEVTADIGKLVLPLQKKFRRMNDERKLIRTFVVGRTD